MWKTCRMKTRMLSTVLDRTEPRMETGRRGADSLREDRRESTCRSKLLVRLFTKELGDPRGTWANDRPMRLRAGQNQVQPAGGYSGPR